MSAAASVPALSVGRRVRPSASALAWGCGAGAVLVQMAFPFTSGGTRLLTVLSVLLLAAAAWAHAWASRGPRALAALVLVAGGGGLLAEAVGVRTGFPFGTYAYADTLGAQVAGVPLVVPLAWTMMAWPALLVARLLSQWTRLATPLVAAWALTTWDVFLDPQMVDAGHWAWADPHPALPGVADVPLTNFAGWLGVALVMCAVLDRVVPRPAAPVPLPGHGVLSAALASDLLPWALYLWTYASSVLAAALFFGRPPVALVGGLLMGTVAVPLALLLARHARGGRG